MHRLNALREVLAKFKRSSNLVTVGRLHYLKDLFSGKRGGKLFFFFCIFILLIFYIPTRVIHTLYLHIAYITFNFVVEVAQEEGGEEAPERKEWGSCLQ